MENEVILDGTLREEIVIFPPENPACQKVSADVK